MTRWLRQWLLLGLSGMLFSLKTTASPKSKDNGITKQTYCYAVKDSLALGLDVYRRESEERQPCVIFVFGGAFMAGHRDDTIYHYFFDTLPLKKLTVVSISYRLGLKGIRHMSVLNTKPLKNAIDMAVEDVYDATNWVINHADSLGIDTSKIIIAGSSAGAVTALESDFYRRNNYPVAQKLPAGFQYAGVLSFAGAILSYHGRLRYEIPPAPTLLFHGTADKVMPYKKIRLFNKGFYGSSWIAQTFKEKGYPYYIYRAEGLGHEMAVLPMIRQLSLITGFINDYVIDKKNYQADVSFHDPGQKPLMTLTIQQLIKKLAQH